MEGGDGLLEAVAADEPHGIVRAAVTVAAQAVHRHDPRVLQTARDLGLEDEPGPAGGVVGVVVEDLLESDLAVQLGVERHEHRAEAPPGVGAEDPEPNSVAGSPDGHRVGGAGGGDGRAPGRGAEVGEGRVEDGVADGAETLLRRPAGVDSGQAPFRVAPVALEVMDEQGVEQVAPGRVEGALAEQDVADRAGPVPGPGVIGGDELGLIDHAVLECEQAEKEVTRGVGGVGHWGLPTLPGRWKEVLSDGRVGIRRGEGSPFRITSHDEPPQGAETRPGSIPAPARSRSGSDQVSGSFRQAICGPVGRKLKSLSVQVTPLRDPGPAPRPARPTRPALAPGRHRPGSDRHHPTDRRQPGRCFATSEHRDRY